MDARPPAVVVIHRQPEVRRLVGVALRLLECHVHELPDAESALAHLEREPCGLVVAGIELPGMSGAEFARQVRATYPEGQPAVILTSPYRRPPGGMEDAFLREPFPLETLLDAVRGVLEARAGTPIPVRHGREPGTSPRPPQLRSR